MTSFIHPFKGLHPKPEFVSAVIAPPYDVVSRQQAKEMARNKPYDFLHISRAEIDLPDAVDDHDESVYQKAHDNFQQLLTQHILIQDQMPGFYIYQMQQGTHIQTGIMAKVSCKAYSEDKIRRHELTRPDKVLDRTKHIEALQAQVSPTLLAHKKDPALKKLLVDLTQTAPLLEAELQGVIHRIWRVDDATTVENISRLLNQHETIYIADGHHRNEAAFQMYCKNHIYTDCLAAIFPEDELVILGYHRVVKNLNGLSVDGFLKQLSENFIITKKDKFEYPKNKGSIYLYLPHQAYELTILNANENQLDVDVLTQKVLTPILSINDIRQDKNIAFIGGADAVNTIKEQIDAGIYAAGFLMYPTSMQELLRVADAHQIMPPKSTWFEPKLADGLLSYIL
ncbi:MAG: DUF1015 domain-containing protein [Gammaproteobacteria bacterium]|jgi:uncharacterized protein (DUF1015 family)